MKRQLLACVCIMLSLTLLSAQGTKENAVEAKMESKITVYMPSPAGLADKLAQGFQKATGCQVEVFQGTTGEIMARIQAEEANPIADVVILASWSDGLAMKDSGKLASYEPKEAARIVKGWIDDQHMLFGSSASAVGVIYNTTLIPTLSEDWDGFAKAEFKDKIAIPDPEKSGACKDFLAGFVTAKGWDTIEQWAQNGLVVPGANKAALEAVTTGEVAVLIAGVDYNAYSSMKKGEPIAIYYPESGTVVNPRPAMIMRSAPHPVAAKAFIDYLFSDEAQDLVTKAFLLPGRNDVTCTDRSNLVDIPQIPTDWDAMRKIATETAAKVNALCAK